MMIEKINNCCIVTSAKKFINIMDQKKWKCKEVQAKKRLRDIIAGL